jgi:hypothetical protein
MENIKAADLFADADSAKTSAMRQEEYLDTLNKSFASPTSVPGMPAPAADPTAVLEQLVANKSLSADAVGALNTALSAQRAATAEIIKDITLSNPLSSSFAAFDLEAPAKLLTPRPTPLRNKLARK